MPNELYRVHRHLFYFPPNEPMRTVPPQAFSHTQPTENIDIYNNPHLSTSHQRIDPHLTSKPPSIPNLQKAPTNTITLAPAHRFNVPIQILSPTPKNTRPIESTNSHNNLALSAHPINVPIRTVPYRQPSTHTQPTDCINIQNKPRPAHTAPT